MRFFRLICVAGGAAVAIFAGGCAAPATDQKQTAEAAKTIEGRLYPLKSGSVIYLPDSILAVNRETSEVLLQSGYVRLESKGQQDAGPVKLKTYGTLVETRGAGEVMATPGRSVRASCLRGTVKLKFLDGSHMTRTLGPGQVATIQLKRSPPPSSGT